MINWYKDLIQSRTEYKGTQSSIGHGQEKNMDEKFWQDVDLWYKLPSWYAIHPKGLFGKPLVHDM